MKPRILTLIVIVCATSGLLGSDEGSATDLYSTEPLSDPVRDVAENTVEFVKFNNWLNANFESTPEDRRQPLKEHLYSLIDSHAKQLYEREGVLIPVGDDILLPQGFVWATRMGVFGAHSVLEELDSEVAGKVHNPTTVPDSFQLYARGDMLTLASKWGQWVAVFPYYFMVGDLRQLRAGNDLQTQIATISTGFGRHTADEGYSQATIMVIYSPEGGQATFRDFWLQMFDLTATDAARDEVSGTQTYRKFDAPSNMHTELLFPEVAKGAMAVSYMGLSGTYEHNRQHFQDFLAALSLPSDG